MGAKWGAATKFCKEDEEKLKGYLLERAEKGVPLSTKNFLMHAGALARKRKLIFKGPLPSRGWCFQFRQRHPELSLRKGEKTGAERHMATTKEITQKFFSELEVIMITIKMIIQYYHE